VLREVSVADYLAYDNSASDRNWRLPAGYGSLIKSLGAEVEHRLACPVMAIGQTHEAVQVEAAQGMVAVEKVIVAVSTATLAKIRFDPPIADAIEAAADLPLGLADKLFLSLAGAEEFPHNAHLIGNPRSAETASYMVRPMGMPVVDAFFGGDGARAIERLNEEDAFAFAIDELAALLGSGIRARLKPIARSCWAEEPWIGGSYSHACPSKAGARKQLTEAGDKRIAFAGEACSPNDFSTAHGAFDSGAAAVAHLFGEQRP
jgi:monoamine oxidase